jgi:hypothetical protein
LQQPPHVFALHVHVPLVVSQTPFPHAEQVAPLVPHEAGDSDAQGWQLPAEPPLQHPEGHEAALQTQLPVLMSQPWPLVHATAVHADVLTFG